jgi:hypothetical protein
MAEKAIGTTEHQNITNLTRMFDRRRTAYGATSSRKSLKKKLEITKSILYRNFVKRKEKHHTTLEYFLRHFENAVRKSSK